jgi:hypothetical protein
MFRRKSDDPATDQPTDQPAESAAESAESAAESARRSRGYTPSKKELGVSTPKRSAAQRRRTAEALPTDRRERAKVLRERERAARAERMAGMRAGDERFLPVRDRGPERALVRDIVDSRRTAGTWFFVGALVILFASNSRFPAEVRLAANLVWVALAASVVVDSILIASRIKRLVRQRFPGTAQRMGSLYTYGIMRSITFRKMRMPSPRVKLGQKV